MEDKILTKTELAKNLKCHVNSVTNWEKSGKIKGHRMGRRVYFNSDEVLRALGM